MSLDRTLVTASCGRTWSVCGIPVSSFCLVVCNLVACQESVAHILWPREKTNKTSSSLKHNLRIVNPLLVTKGVHLVEHAQLVEYPHVFTDAKVVEGGRIIVVLK